MSVFALITARGGSKGLRRKNLKTLLHKPLIYWTIQPAKDSAFVEFVCVSTEDDEIKEVSLGYGAKVADRPYELATDQALSEDVIAHFISQEKSLSKDDLLVLLQPTSPMRTAKHIDEAIRLYNSNPNTKCVISVYEPLEHPAKAYTKDKAGNLVGLYSSSAPYMRRQDLPICYCPNGAIYVFKVKDFLQLSKIPRDSVVPYVMDISLSRDIDTIEDLEQCEFKMKEIGYE